MKHHVLICLLALCAFRTGLAQSADFASTYYPYINRNVNIWEMEEAMANDFEGFSIKLEPRTKK